MNGFFGLLVAVLGCASCAAPAGQLIEVSRLDPTYERTQPVQMTLKNVGPDNLRAYSNLEVVDEDGKWITWPFRVEDGRLDAIAKMYPLRKGEWTTIVFDITKINLPAIPVGEQSKKAKQLKFRFRVVALAAHGDERKAELFSDPFVVKQPYQ